MSFLVKEIENCHVAWFEKSNQWVVFDEPRWFIFDLYNKGLDVDSAAKRFKHHSKFSASDPVGFVANIYDSIDNLLNRGFPLPDFTIQSVETKNFRLEEKRTYYYEYNGKLFSLAYGSPVLKNYFHSPMAHLESEKTVKHHFHADIFSFQGRFALRIKNGGCFTADESSQVKRLLYIELASLFYGVKKDRWLTLMHASAIRKGDEILALSSASGSGKSTMASLLYARQCGFVSDDFVPVDVPGNLAYPFPAAICLKGELPEIVLNNYPELKRETISGHQFVYPSITGQGRRIKKLVFIRYLPGGQNQIKQVPIVEALKFYLQESWVTSDPSQVEVFLNWFTGLKFYEFVYSDEEKAVVSIMELFEKQ